ncbi:putative zinc finger CCHC domain-containing protein 3-like [Apostichopus japonicus]|uniref:Putative zinc finger CCHC domain-containing protein 3-like n=1 Tax=Stichopus japonicus TaxID=307972 RepID=A0A2G8KBL6_STIJA|nr:putative zinc finger CCHC domain-containing protein 3-like [Apostichopus japonicus]PIK45415.1 putative zinc finger CCHC domain-containing protein 3-like [Apostichopus japonicus]
MASSVRRNCSVLLRCADGVCTPRQVFEILESVGATVASVLDAVQVLPNKSMDVTFKTVALKRAFVKVLRRLPSVVVEPYSNDYVVVTVLNVEHELNDNIVKFALGMYGKVVASRWCVYPEYPSIFNGNRQYKVVLEKDIPSSLRIGARNISVRYPGQPFTCLRCGGRDHRIKECPNLKCFLCLGLGHQSKDCKEGIRCSICLELGHPFRACPMSFARKAHTTAAWDRESQGSDSEEEAPTVVTPAAPTAPPGSVEPAVATVSQGGKEVATDVVESEVVEEDPGPSNVHTRTCARDEGDAAMEVKEDGRKEAGKEKGVKEGKGKKGVKERKTVAEGSEKKDKASNENGGKSKVPNPHVSDGSGSEMDEGDEAVPPVSLKRDLAVSDADCSDSSDSDLMPSDKSGRKLRKA